MPDVEVREVTKSFGKVVALNEVSFELKDKEFLPLLGQQMRARQLRCVWLRDLKSRTKARCSLTADQ